MLSVYVFCEKIVSSRVQWLSASPAKRFLFYLFTQLEKAADLNPEDDISGVYSADGPSLFTSFVPGELLSIAGGFSFSVWAASDLRV